MPTSLSRSWLLGVIAVSLCGSRPAVADDVGAARDAYARGSKAYKKGEYDAAAELFARADGLAPNAVALEAALRAAVHADRAVLGMELVRRAESRDATGTLLEASDAARTEFEGRIGRLTVVCGRCAPTVDGKTWEPNKAREVESGYHLVSLQPGDGAEKRLVHVVPGKATRFAPAPEQEQAAAAAAPAAARPEPSKPDAPAGPSIRGLSIGWFWASAGVTAALGAATIASQVDTAGKHADYLETPSLQGAADGQAAETRTHVLLGFTGAALVSTAAIGIFAVRWKEPARAPTLVGAAPIAGGGIAAVRGGF